MALLLPDGIVVELPESRHSDVAPLPHGRSEWATGRRCYGDLSTRRATIRRLMTPDNQEMTLRDYGGVVDRRKWVVIAAVRSLRRSLSVLLSALQTPVYSASSEVLVQPRGQDGLFENQIVNLNDRAIETEIQVVEGEAVRSRVQQDLGARRAAARGGRKCGRADRRDLDRSPRHERSQCPDPGRRLCRGLHRRSARTGRQRVARGECRGAARHRRTAGATSTRCLTMIPTRRRSLPRSPNFGTTLDQLRVDAALRTGGAAIIQPAELPDTPVEPTPATDRHARRCRRAAASGSARHSCSTTSTTRSARRRISNRLTDRPVLAVVPVDPPPDSRPIAVSEPSHDAVEAYRGLRTNLMFLGLDRPIRVIQVTSSLAGEGKTTTSANLAVVLAQAGHRVASSTPISGDPGCTRCSAQPQTPGFTDLLLGTDAT